MSDRSRAIGIAFAAAAAAFATPLSAQTGGLEPRSACTGAVCTIDVQVRESSGAAQRGCKVAVSSETGMPLGIHPVEWRIRTPGFAFAPGGQGVTIHNNASDFSASAGSTSTVFKLTRSSTVPQGRVYEYDLKVRKNGSDVFCMVPTLPRIKNE